MQKIFEKLLVQFYVLSQIDVEKNKNSLVKNWVFYNMTSVLNTFVMIFVILSHCHSSSTLRW